MSTYCIQFLDRFGKVLETHFVLAEDSLLAISEAAGRVSEESTVFRAEVTIL